jgi:hypothetical protein
MFTLGLATLNIFLPSVIVKEESPPFHMYVFGSGSKEPYFAQEH